MKKLFLRFLFSSKKLNVINDKDVIFPIVLFKALHIFVLDSINKLVSELLEETYFTFFPL